jgi:hypothetical protein
MIRQAWNDRSFVTIVEALEKHILIESKNETWSLILNDSTDKPAARV